MTARLFLILAVLSALGLVPIAAYAIPSGVVIDASKGAVLLGSPAGVANCNANTTGAIRYNSTNPAIEFCNGSAWTALYQVQSTPVITAPAGSGYFVLSSSTYNGNLGGLNGADATCLTELTTNTGWAGHATAQANGQLVASKVHAFLCVSSICNNLMPLTTYAFANAGNSAAGGATFTTDSGNRGPNDSGNWSAANYFSSSNQYWTGRTNTGTNTAWDLTNALATCSSFASTASTGIVGSAASTTATRWVNNSALACTSTFNLICFVNP